MRYSAGVRDSELTNHGKLQAERLGEHFAQADFKFTEILSSDLQRAYKTAEAIRLAQVNAEDTLVVSQSPLLREQDFGWYEGQPFHVRRRGSRDSVKEADCFSQHPSPDFKDVESKDSMVRRTEVFVQEKLLPLLHGELPEQGRAVCIVSHGIILSYLWRSFLKVFPKQNVALAPGLSMGKGGPTLLENLGGWSNTGYLELNIHRHAAAVAITSDHFTNAASISNPDATDQPSPLQLASFEMTILTVNGKRHLNNLKRTRGGVGSSRHDEGQKKIEDFFKKQKLIS
jgi:broad specificity phosphatase PhoE